jgi:hypothetical protein
MCSAGASAGDLPTLLVETFSTTFAVRPALITYAGDGSAFVGGPGVSRASFNAHRFGHIRWTSWTDTQAVGSGIVWLDNGIPDEASGTFYPHNVSVRASRVRSGRFTRLLLTYRLGSRTVGIPLRLSPGGPGFVW